jgi:hypothetical protein
MAVFDLFDQATLTDVVRLPLQRSTATAGEDGAKLGEVIAPFKSLQSRVARMQVMDVIAFGLGQFKAPDATPPLYKPQTEWKEQVIELVLLEEMERISGEDWLKLHSSDPVISRVAGATLVERGQILQLRNERLTEWMRWQAFTGSLTVTYPTGSQLYIDYGLPPTHKPTVSTLWSDVANADPVTDIQAWSEVLAADSGFYGNRLHMNSKTWDYLIRNTKIKNMVNFYAPSAPTINRPTKALILELFTSFATNVEIVIYDNGYRAEGLSGFVAPPAQITKYLPDGFVLMTAGGSSYAVDGDPIADTLDGQVLVGEDFDHAGIRQGVQSEVIFDNMSKNHFFRQASARIPRIRHPECFLYAKVA